MLPQLFNNQTNESLMLTAELESYNISRLKRWRPSTTFETAMFWNVDRRL